MQNVLGDKETGDEFWAGHQLEKPQKPSRKASEKKWKKPKEMANKNLKNQANSFRQEAVKKLRNQAKRTAGFGIFSFQPGRGWFQ